MQPDLTPPSDLTNTPDTAWSAPPNKFPLRFWEPPKRDESVPSAPAVIDAWTDRSRRVGAAEPAYVVMHPRIVGPNGEMAWAGDGERLHPYNLINGFDDWDAAVDFAKAVKGCVLVLPVAADYRDAGSDT